MEFYEKKFSHPHPLVRCMNIMEYYFNSITTDLPRLEMDFQELLNNTFGIARLYFDMLVPKQNAISELFKDLKEHLESINKYNGELYDYAIQDEAIRNLLLLRNVEFEDVQPT